jgi:hypothetical protein
MITVTTPSTLGWLHRCSPASMVESLCNRAAALKRFPVGIGRLMKGASSIRRFEQLTKRRETTLASGRKRACEESQRSGGWAALVLTRGRFVFGMKILKSTIASAPHLVAYPHGFRRWLEEESVMQVHTFTFLDLAYRSSKLRDESVRLGCVSKGLLEDSHRLRPDAAELKINVQSCRTKISKRAFQSYSNRP